MTPSAARVCASTKRKYRRIPVNQPALVAFATVPGRVWTARIADVSRHGMQLILENPPLPDPEICIQWANREICGTVRYRGQRGGQFRLGVALADRWDVLLIDLLARETVALRRTGNEAAASAAALRQRMREMANALEAATQASQVKSRFLAGVSHEFRTPLNGIIGFSELLYDAKAGPVTIDQKDYLSDILSCSRHLLTLINQVLDLTKIESGKMDFHYEEVPLEALAREVIDGVKALAAGWVSRARPE